MSNMVSLNILCDYCFTNEMNDDGICYKRHKITMSSFPFVEKQIDNFIQRRTLFFKFG